MTTPQQQIEADLKSAMKAGDKERLSTLRMLLTEIKNERIRAGSEVDERTLVSLVRKGIKQRHESAEQFRNAGREETAAKEEREAAILEEYLPKQAGEGEIRRAVEELAAEQGLAGPQDLGKVMRPMIERFGATADGATLQRIAREVLTARAAG